LFAPAGENFAPVADPCNGVTAVDDPGTTIDDNCRSIPEIAARIAATGSFTLTQPEIQGTGGFTGGGNPNLKTETSDSYSIGGVLSHNFGAAGNIMASVDWYQIEIQGLIATVGRQEAIDFCFDVPTGEFPNPFCSLLVRDATGPAFQLGELTEVNSTFINEGSLKTEGVDVSVSWNFTLADWISEVPGDVSLRFNYTHLIEFEVTQFGQPDDLKGEVGTPEDKWQGAIVYSVGPATLQWETTYVGDAVPDNAAGGLFNFDVGKYVVHDARIGFDIFENANIYVGSNNILDEEAPIVLSGVPGNSTGTDTNASVYDPMGRTFFAGIRLRY
jgi:outer membrane receptor protein involved in Fe transport